MDIKHITIITNRTEIMLGLSTILYVAMVGKNAEIHVSGGKVYKTRMTFSKLSEQLGDDFIKVNRGCLVSAMAIHEITDNIYLSNGESIVYTVRKKKRLLNSFVQSKRA